MQPLPSIIIEMTKSIATQKLITFSVLGMLLFSVLLLITFTQNANAESGKILKWKDDKGTTQYGDRIPPQYANRESTSISQQGIAIKRNKPAIDQDVTSDIAKQDQDKKDKALLNAFTNENEIDLARDRNLQVDLTMLENLQLEKNTIQKRLADNKKSADSFTKQKKKIPADLNADMANNQVANARLEQRISERKTTIENIRQRFERDKQRYTALKNHTIESGAPIELPLPAMTQDTLTSKPVVSSNR